ncbi:cell envelope integrity protein CreD [Mucilaginibacter sp. KACC 22063]|uniref:cell envelope integrity protein CreD n=1 Tax=Mucilaginibacter sp. KACC 22063 TaxID=3025666 RepID=UPI0023650E78|nr:cell envelope integrity protein CreD [Mucilaginibacter sp. KACC 22063]WDF54929.1 cell envelope integrity protein CreD [Mucilaginibacter sp. KACC 22063]
MITEQEPKSTIGRIMESVTLKLIFITGLVLVLLIPSFLVQNLIQERAGRQQEMETDVSDKWSGKQLVAGPVLVMPYKRIYKENEGTAKEVTKTSTEYLYVLPDDLHISSGLNVETLHRGIFNTTVYNTRIDIKGNFPKADLEKAGITADQLIPEKAIVTFNISDLKGLKTNPVVNLAGKSFAVEPALNNASAFNNGLQAWTNITGLTDKDLPFNFTLDLKGSQELNFVHLGKTTTVDVKSNWASPSFTGRYLPDSRKIDKNGFTAKWRMLYYNRPFPQQWTMNDSLLNSMSKHEEAIFGVKLRIPVDQYQQTTRTSKYAILIIILTFISLFLTELIGKQKVHVFNYALIGAAMIIFYVLLLSFSEQIGYMWAYLVASIATIALISLFISSLLHNKKAALLFAFILSLFYTFIYIIIQLEDLALLVGSVLLFIIIAVLMYFSRKINWDRY